jgi:lysyl-tRNA synthetase class 2
MHRFRSFIVPQMRPEKKRVQLEEDEKTIVAIQKPTTKWSLVLLKIKSDLSGKKMDKAMKNLFALRND